MLEQQPEVRERFSVAADLAKQPWFKANGRVTGEAVVTSAATGAIPTVEFTLAARDAAVADWTLARAEVL